MSAHTLEGGSMGVMLIPEATMPTILDSHPILADVVRIAIIASGFTMTLLLAKLALRSAQRRDWDRTFWLLAVGLFILTPSISGLYRFNQPLNLWTTLTYLAALGFGAAALAARLTVNWHRWTRGGAHRDG